MRTADEIKELLAQKFTVENKRLKSYGTKYSTFDLAHAVYRWVQSLMSESRYGELKRVIKLVKEEYGDDFEKSKLMRYLQERKKATKAMAKALEHIADANDKNRPWKRTVKKDKKKKHGHSRSSRKSKH